MAPYCLFYGVPVGDRGQEKKWLRWKKRCLPVQIQSPETHVEQVLLGCITMKPFTSVLNILSELGALGTDSSLIDREAGEEVWPLWSSLRLLCWVVYIAIYDTYI